MLKNCPECKVKMIKIKKSPVVNLANPRNKIPPSSDWWVCQNCGYGEKV